MWETIFIKEQIFTLDKPDFGLLEDAVSRHTAGINMKRSIGHNSKFLRLMRDNKNKRML